MTNKYYEDEIRKISNQRKGLRDQYNTLDNAYDETQIEKIIYKDLDYAPSPKQTWISYAETLNIYKKLCEKHNIQAHINSPKGAWYTHRNPAQTCWMCDDLNLLNVMYDTILYMAKKHPDTTF